MKSIIRYLSRVFFGFHDKKTPLYKASSSQPSAIRITKKDFIGSLATTLTDINCSGFIRMPSGSKREAFCKSMVIPKNTLVKIVAVEIHRFVIEPVQDAQTGNKNRPSLSPTLQS